jgi:hypothetical protein
MGLVNSMLGGVILFRKRGEWGAKLGSDHGLPKNVMKKCAVLD